MAQKNKTNTRTSGSNNLEELHAAVAELSSMMGLPYPSAPSTANQGSFATPQAAPGMPNPSPMFSSPVQYPTNMCWPTPTVPTTAYVDAMIPMSPWPMPAPLVNAYQPRNYVFPQQSAGMAPVSWGPFVFPSSIR